MHQPPGQEGECARNQQAIDCDADHTGFMLGHIARADGANSIEERPEDVEGQKVDRGESPKDIQFVDPEGTDGDQREKCDPGAAKRFVKCCAFAQEGDG